jgi:hypothetical protein
VEAAAVEDGNRREAPRNSSVRYRTSLAMGCPPC